ncbi:MAG TPA: bacterial transcriptional activator domain-containing protein [Acidimicrobiales bacterium]|nr:bacterial transcriptional activator domain-containing protein [Acidimicrobiales bacterium]
MARAVRGNADVSGLARLDAALRHLATKAELDRGNRSRRSGHRVPRESARQTSEPVPQVILRHPEDSRIEVFLAEPVETAYVPWEARAGGTIWTLTADAPLTDDGTALVPCPALVQMGTTDDEAELFVDLEALGILGLDGNPEAVRQIARALTATLVVSPAAAYCRVLTYGFDPLGLDTQDRLRLVVGRSVDAVLSEAESTAGPVAEAVDAEAAGSSFRLRGLVPEEGWEPAVVIVAAGDLSPEEDERLTSLGVEGGRGAAVVKAGTAPRWTLAADEPPGWWRLNPLGVRVRPVGIAAEELKELAGYLAEADAAPVDVAVVEPVATSPNGHVGHVQPDPPPAAAREPEWQAMVRVLGPVDIVDSSRVPQPVDRNQPLELVAWLATNRGRATRTRAIDALWSGRAIDPRSIRNVITSARILLRNVAGDPPNEQWIPHRQQELELDPLVVTDVDLLRARIAYARQLGPDERAAVLAEGLELVRGIPFEGSPWLWADDLVSDMSVDVVDMILDLAQLRLQAGDMRGAVEAAGVGLRVIPLHEQLTELSMQAWTASGERRRALDVYEAYERAVAARGEEVAPEIARLRNELLRAVPHD